ncbi:MAG: hypothetical protein J6T51_01905 [Kiritimatiellae bacterium]|nr:hypothetical protein [Kiritimatiellia bacterium]
MAVTETTTVGWGSRLGTSIKGVLFGLILFVVGFPVLFMNEGNYVKTAKALDEGEGACVALESAAAVDPEMDGRLVHVSGRADTKDVLSDDVFGVSATAIRLSRKVEMYQWRERSRTEEKKKLGGGVEKTTTYTYSKVWSDELLPSGDFKESGHDNPAAMEFASEERVASSVSLGAFRLNERQIARIGSAQAYAFPTDFVCRVERVQRQGATIYVPEQGTRDNRLNNRVVATQPRIGDMRVTFEVVYPHDISIVAKQRGDTFVGYTAKTGKKVDLLSDGLLDSAEMFASARSGNSMFTWFVRVGGFVLMFLGLSMVLKPLSVVADVLPILGDIVEMGAGIVAFVVALVCALVTVSIAWLFYRPVVAILILAAAGGFAWWLVQRRRKRAGAVSPA